MTPTTEPGGATGHLARRALALAVAPPDAAIARAGNLLLDALGLMLSGLGSTHGDTVARYAAQAACDPRATVVGYGLRCAPEHAALANGVLCYTHDFGDTLLASVVHGEPAIVPAALAAAEAEGRGGAALLAALVAGYEVAGRLGLAVNGAANRMALHTLGFHPTALCGIFGAAAAAGVLYRLDTAQLTHALGLAASFAGGILEPLTATPMTDARRLSGGQAAFLGLHVAGLARTGFTAPATALEGPHGLLHACTGGRFDAIPLGPPAGDEVPQILDTAIKYRNCIHAAAAPIDAALALLTEQSLPASAITRIEVALPTAHHALMSGRPADLRPTDHGEAQTSLAWCVAAACVHGGLAVAEFAGGRLADPAVLDLAARVEAHTDATLDAAFTAGAWPAEVTLTLADGRRLQRRVDYPLGSPQNPLEAAALEGKFAATAGAVLDQHGRAAASAAVHDLAAAPDLVALLAAVTPGPPPIH